MGRRAGYVRSITVHVAACLRGAVQDSSGVSLQSCARIWRTIKSLSSSVIGLTRKIRAARTLEEERQKLEDTSVEEDEHSWYSDEGEFEVHCQHHIDHPAAIPLEYGFLEVCGMLAWPGFCSSHGGILRSATVDQAHEPSLRRPSLELQYHYDDLHCMPAPKKWRTCEPKCELSNTPQVAADDGTELEVLLVTTPGSFKRRGVDTNHENGEAPRKQRNDQEISKEMGAAEPGTLSTPLAPGARSATVVSAATSPKTLTLVYFVEGTERRR
ncbi:hypothetical protein FQN55_006242 [Onygenales sp. PD_40]|nr:hypothetical protein FQN55_006242 [Onygenales sp. PD_40]